MVLAMEDGLRADGVVVVLLMRMATRKKGIQLDFWWKIYEGNKELGLNEFGRGIVMDFMIRGLAIIEKVGVGVDGGGIEYTTNGLCKDDEYRERRGASGIDKIGVGVDEAIGLCRFTSMEIYPWKTREMEADFCVDYVGVCGEGESLVERDSLIDLVVLGLLIAMLGFDVTIEMSYIWDVCEGEEDDGLIGERKKVCGGVFWVMEEPGKDGVGSGYGVGRYGWGLRVSKSIQEIMYDDPLESYTIQGEKNDGDDPIRVEQVARLEATKFIVRNKAFEEINKGKETRSKPSIEDLPNLEL
ncbi:unnamed protein product [Dovyalis caffra]|uniref:Uncharacterized protein n=1 Tax=Dovyalis caffra TaxID=77055 RepID=A0AAV1RH05_9ROSI|nr:unnamed protein product [Dovyalis caffra]